MIEMFEWKATSRLWGGCMSYSFPLAEVPGFSMPQLLRSVVFSHEMIVWSCMIPLESNISNINQSLSCHPSLSWYPGSLQSPISCKELGDIACRSNVSPFGQRLKFTCVLVFFVTWMIGVRFTLQQPAVALTLGWMQKPIPATGLSFLERSWNSVDLDLPNVSFSKRGFPNMTNDLQNQLLRTEARSLSCASKRIRRNCEVESCSCTSRLSRNPA